MTRSGTPTSTATRPQPSSSSPATCCTPAGTRNVRQLVREQLLALSGQQDPALTAHATKKAGEDAKRKLGEQCRQFEFTLLLSVLHTRLDMMTEMWPRVEAALNLVGTSNALSRRPPEDYRPLVPESPMGNILGFQFQPDSSSGEPQSGELRFFRCAGSGRELLLGLPRLTAADGLPAPHVVLMSGTSWAGTSTRYHVLTEVGAILKPPQKELDAIDRTTFTTCFLKDAAGKPLKLSGAKPHLRPLVLEQMLSQLARPRPDGSASPMQAELAAIDDDNRRRLLLLTGSYDEARRAADYLETIERWAGRVCRLVSDDAEQDHLWREAAHLPSAPRGGPGTLRRGDVATFAETGAEVLVAPLLAIERGHNILNDEGTAAIGSVFFLARPHPRPDDIGLAIQAVNDWAARMLRNGSFRELVRDAGQPRRRRQGVPPPGPREVAPAAEPADGLVPARPGREGLVHLGSARGHLAGHRQARARRRARPRRVRGRALRGAAGPGTHRRHGRDQPARQHAARAGPVLRRP